MKLRLIGEQPITLYFARVDYNDWKGSREYEMVGPYRQESSAKGQATKLANSIKNNYARYLRMSARMDGIKAPENISYDKLEITTNVIGYHLIPSSIS